MNKQEELKSAEEILNENSSIEMFEYDSYDKSTVFKAMEEYADQFKKQLKEYGITMSKYLKIIGELTDQEQELKSKIKEKEEEIERLKKIVNDDSDYKAMRNYAKELEHKLGINPNSKK